MDVTNKTLGLLLIAAIVVSLGGTFVSLNKLDGVSTTGYATNNESGTVTLSVGAALSIVLPNAPESIPFGECIPDVTLDLILDSSLGQAGVNNSVCSLTGAFPDNITLENDGNVDANVTVRADVNGTNLFDAPVDNGWIAYKANNVAGDAGCSTGTLQTAYRNFTVEDDDPGDATDLDDNPVCDNLTYGNAADRIALSIRIQLPAATTSTVGLSTITFEATESGV